MKSRTCPVGDGPMRVKAAKNGKPFADCKSCTLQILVRTHEGADRFSARYGTAWKGEAPAPTPKPAAPAAKKAPAPAVKKAAAAATPPKKGGLFGF